MWFSLRHWEGQGQVGEGLVKGARALQVERQQPVNRALDWICPPSGELSVTREEASLSLLAQGRALPSPWMALEGSVGHSLLQLDSPVVMEKRSDFRQGWEGQVGVEMDLVTVVWKGNVFLSTCL